MSDGSSDQAVLVAFDRLRDDIADLPPKESVAAVARFFRGMDSNGYDANLLGAHRRDAVGELDGAPWRLRVRVNTERLKSDRDTLRRRYAGPDEIGPDGLAPAALGRMSTEDRTRLDTLNQMLAPDQVVTERDPKTGYPSRVTEAQRQFLSLSTAGDGKTVEVLGDLSTAENVVVNIHGIGVTIDDPTTVGMAKAIHAAADKDDPGKTVVLRVVYDAPNDLKQTLTKDAAYEAARTMLSLIEGVHSEARNRLRTTLNGHSFGSIVALETVRDGRVFADHVNFQGSPGLGHDLRTIADAKADPRTLFTAQRADGDVVSVSQFHGIDPVELPGVVRLATAGPGDPTVVGHEQYWKTGSMSVVNLARLARGEYSALQTTSRSLADDTRLALGLSWGTPVRGISTTAGRVVGRCSTTPPGRPPNVVPDQGRPRPAATARAGDGR